jgi:ABC-type glycerol-3-phosphate transport system substrate-binding protein
MKKLLSTIMVLGSAASIAACAANGTTDADLDGTLTQAPYAEERTVGATEAPARPVVRSAEPVFESRQVK